MSETPPGNPPPGNPPPAAKWYDGFETPELKEWLGNYNDAYPNPEAVALKAFNLEKFVGHEKAGRGIVIPKDDAKPEEWKAFYNKLGAPASVDGYVLPTEMQADPLLSKLRETAFNTHMPKAMFDNIIKMVGETGKAAQEEQMRQFAQKSELEYAQLKGEWGPDAARNEETGRRAAKAFIPHTDANDLADKISRIEGALGTAFTLKLFANIGNSISEHGFVDGEGPPGGGTQSASSARAEIAVLKADPEFGKKLMAGDAESKKKWDSLHQLAYPGSTAL